jgi:hypothetical protein
MSGNLEIVRKPVHNKCFGIEIECYVPNGTELAIIRNGDNRYRGFWKIDSDGSIDIPTYRHCAVELVSQPLPYRWLFKEIGKLEKKYGNWHFNSSCGIHVHVTKKAVSSRRIRELRVALSRMSGYELTYLFGRGNNAYSNAGNTLRGQRYGAINETNDATYEFRMFASGHAKLMCEYKGEYTFESLQELFRKNV